MTKKDETSLKTSLSLANKLSGSILSLNIGPDNSYFLALEIRTQMYDTQIYGAVQVIDDVLSVLRMVNKSEFIMGNGT